MATETLPDIEAPVPSSPEGLRELAVRRLKQRQDFRAHLLIYTLVNLVVWGIWLTIALTSGGSWPWPIFITLGWGIGLVMNAWDVYWRRPITEADVEHELERLRR